MQLVVTGSIAFDYLMSFPGKFSDVLLPDKLDRISVSFLVDSMRRQHGGCAANIAYSLALLDERPILVGAVGEDFDSYRQALAKIGVDTSKIHKHQNVYTASFFANTDQDENQICSFYTGAMQYAKEISLKGIISPEDTLVIISPNDPGAMMKYTEECRAMGVAFIYDPSQQVVRLRGDDLINGVRGAEMMILNDYEMELFLKKTKIKEKDILALTKMVVITMGEKGSVMKGEWGECQIPVVPPHEILDPTGVGDAYRAGIMKGIVLGLPWDIVGRMGSLAATYVLETEGPQSHYFSMKTFLDRYMITFGESEVLRSIKN